MEGDEGRASDPDSSCPRPSTGGPIHTARARPWRYIVSTAQLCRRRVTERFPRDMSQARRQSNFGLRVRCRQRAQRRLKAVRCRGQAGLHDSVSGRFHTNILHASSGDLSVPAPSGAHIDVFLRQHNGSALLLLYKCAAALLLLPIRALIAALASHPRPLPHSAQPSSA